MDLELQNSAKWRKKIYFIEKLYGFLVNDQRRKSIKSLECSIFSGLTDVAKGACWTTSLFYIAFEVVLQAPSGLLFELLWFDKCFDMRWVSYSDCMIVCWVLMRPKALGHWFYLEARYGTSQLHSSFVGHTKGLFVFIFICMHWIHMNSLLDKL